MPEAPEEPKVFISYSHDGEAHETRILDLANRLRDEGVDAEIDQYEVSPPEGWPAWCERNIRRADFVLLVCTELYLRRFDDADPGGGLGVLYEARNIRQLIYDDRAKTGKYIPVLFDGGSPDHIPTPVKGAKRWELDRPGGYEGLYRQLTDQPKVVKPGLGKRRSMPPKESRSGPAVETAAPVAAVTPARPSGDGVPHPRAGEVFVGRAAQLRVLTACLLPEDPGKRRPVAVMGMAGVGKSYLVDRFFLENRTRFPGEYHRLALDAEKLGTAPELLAALADRLKLPATAGDAAIAAALTAPLALIHVENVDTDEAAAVTGALVRRLPGCALVLSARLTTLAAGTGWGAAPLTAFDEAEASEQLRQELGAAAPDAEALRPIIAVLGGLPLALHLAAGYLQAGETPEKFLKLLRRQGLSLAPINKADPSFQERSRTRLEAVFVLSLAALERSARTQGYAAETWRDAFAALGYGPAAGFGESLGAAVAGLDADAFADLARAACALSLLDRVLRDGATAFRLHPLLAELGRKQADGAKVIARITEWFCERLPMRPTEATNRWNEVHAETAALLDWLPQVPPADRLRVVEIGGWFAIYNGPFHAWRRFGEAALADAADDAERSNVLWMLGNVTLRGGDADAALAWAREKREVDTRSGAEREAAVASSQIADILYARGELDEALRIRTEEELPVYERLGDARARAVTQRNIADILEARGQPDAALRLLREEALPAVRQIGAIRDVAVFQGRIADILEARGELEEALRIRTEELLPAFERLGDVRERAVTQRKIADILEAHGLLDAALRLLREEALPAVRQIGAIPDEAVFQGRIADILSARGELDEALRILRDELLPAFERLGDVRERAVTMGKIADILYARGELEEALRIRREEQLPVYERLGDVRERAVTMGRIADILFARGELDEALRIRREEELPVYQRLGDVRSLLVGRAKLAIALLKRNNEGDREEARCLLCLALADARRLGIPEAATIEQWLRHFGLSCE